MDVHEIKDTLFELGETLQDIYIAREYGKRQELAALGEKLKGVFQLLRDMKCTLSLYAEYCYLRPGGLEWKFETDTEWDDLDEILHTAYLKISIRIDGTKGHVEITKGNIEAGFYLEQEADPDDEHGDPGEGDRPVSPPPGQRLISREETEKILHDIGIDIAENPD